MKIELAIAIVVIIATIGSLLNLVISLSKRQKYKSDIVSTKSNKLISIDSDFLTYLKKPKVHSNEEHLKVDLTESEEKILIKSASLHGSRR